MMVKPITVTEYEHAIKNGTVISGRDVRVAQLVLEMNEYLTRTRCDGGRPFCIEGYTQGIVTEVAVAYRQAGWDVNVHDTPHPEVYRIDIKPRISVGLEPVYSTEESPLSFIPHARNQTL